MSILFLLLSLSNSNCLCALSNMSVGTRKSINAVRAFCGVSVTMCGFSFVMLADLDDLLEDCTGFVDVRVVSKLVGLTGITVEYGVL